MTDNNFAIGDKVIRRFTETAHIIEDVSYNHDLQTMHPATGEFAPAASPWNYKIDGIEQWIVETALMKKPDDWVDPNEATKQTEKVV